MSHDVEERLRLHTEGEVQSSRTYRPYKAIYMKAYETLSEARKEELFYKSRTGRRKLKQMLSS